MLSASNLTSRTPSRLFIGKRRKREVRYNQQTYAKVRCRLINVCEEEQTVLFPHGWTLSTPLQLLVGRQGGERSSSVMFLLWFS